LDQNVPLAIDDSKQLVILVSLYMFEIILYLYVLGVSIKYGLERLDVAGFDLINRY